MKNRALVSERGTITIPESIRRTVNIRPGDLMEFKPEKDRIILRHLIVKHSEEESIMADSEWDKFDKIIQSQIKEVKYSSYSDIDKAKLHSRNLMNKK